MSSLAVTAEPLTIHTHPDADALELAQVGLYRAVVGKDAYKTGDYAVYIPEQAVLPAALIEELGLTGRLAGKAKDRVKAVRLRGELSQGIVCRPAALEGVDLESAHAMGIDFAELLGISKWVPPVPVAMAGQVESAPELLPWIDIENLKRYPGVFEAGEPVTATEKIHGSACLLTYFAATGEVQVSSKGVGSRGLAIIEAPGNLYWRAIHAHGVPVIAARLATELGASRVGIFGEVFGAGVQDLGYGTDLRHQQPGYAVFDISYDDGTGNVRWLDSMAVIDRVGDDIRTAPLLYVGPYDVDLMLNLAEGDEDVSGQRLHMREGLVIRPAFERRSDLLGGRAIAKVVSGSYLTRKGGTEFE